MLGLKYYADSTMLLATHTSGQQLMLYRITFNFQRLAFDIQHLKTLSDCFPKGIHLGNPGLGETSASAQLTHLEYFPQGPENLKGDPARPFVLAAFTSLAHHNQEPYSIVCRWELHSIKPQLHSQFEQLSKKSNSSLPDLPVRMNFCCHMTKLSNENRWKSPSRGCQTRIYPKSFSMCNNCV